MTWILTLWIAFVAQPNIAEVNGLTANLEAGTVKVQVGPFSTRAACESFIDSDNVPTTFQGAPISVTRFSCQKSD